MLTSMSKNTKKQENPIISLFANIVIPVFVLHKFSAQLNPKNALIIALVFPVTYAIWDFLKRRHFSFIALLGFLNVLITGSFALLKLSGGWFAIKEAAFPALVGIFVLISSWTRRPFIETILLNPQIMRLDLLEQDLKASSSEEKFHQLLVLSTRLMSLSFFISAFLNLFLALKIFTVLPSGLSDTESSILLNEQIAKMTSWSMLVIALPSMIMMAGLLFFIFKKIEKITGLSWQKYMQN